MDTFMQLYYNDIIVKKRHEYLTEKQLPDGGPILVDLDFRYSYDTTTRQHTMDQISDLIHVYIESIKQLFDFSNGDKFPIIVMEKPNVNRVQDKHITKDGIHMIIGIKCDHILQQMLRNRVLAIIGDVIDLPITNTWEDVLDSGISKGCTNWQMYGSHKPGHETYRVTYNNIAVWNQLENEFDISPQNPNEFHTNFTNFYKLSARYMGHPSFKLLDEITAEYEKMSQQEQQRTRTTRSRINLLYTEDEPGSIHDIRDADALSRAVNAIMDSLQIHERHIHEIHQYAQILPDKYYKPGSHVLNRKVAFALKHTDERLFLSWVMLRAKAEDFDYSEIPNHI